MSRCWPLLLLCGLWTGCFVLDFVSLVAQVINIFFFPILIERSLLSERRSLWRRSNVKISDKQVSGPVWEAAGAWSKSGIQTTDQGDFNSLCSTFLLNGQCPRNSWIWVRQFLVTVSVPRWWVMCHFDGVFQLHQEACMKQGGAPFHPIFQPSVTVCEMHAKRCKGHSKLTVLHKHRRIQTVSWITSFILMSNNTAREAQNFSVTSDDGTR